MTLELRDAEPVKVVVTAVGVVLACPVCRAVALDEAVRAEVVCPNVILWAVALLVTVRAVDVTTFVTKWAVEVGVRVKTVDDARSLLSCPTEEVAAESAVVLPILLLRLAPAEVVAVREVAV